MTGDTKGSIGRRPGRAIRRGLLDAVGFVGVAFRLLFRHWPALFALALLGAGAAWGIAKLAVEASKLAPLAGLLVLMLVPVAILTMYVLMMRIMRNSLPYARAIDDASKQTGRPASLLSHLGSVLVPFLAVYSSQGFVADLLNSYSYDVKFDVQGQRFADMLTVPADKLPTFGARLDVSLNRMAIGVIVIAFVARWLIGILQKRTKARWLGVIGAYLESVWLMLVLIPLAAVPPLAKTWIGDRRIIVWSGATKAQYVSQLGILKAPVNGTLHYFVGLFGTAQTVVLLPVAWLTVGAVVYGHRLADLAPTGKQGSRVAKPTGFTPLRWAGTRLGGELRERFGPLIGGLRLLARGSTRPMLLFCVLFILVSPLMTAGGKLYGLEAWLWDLERMVIGPRESGTWLTLSAVFNPLNGAVQAVVVICLLSAAIDRLVLAQRVDAKLREAPARSAASPAEPSPGGPSAASAGSSSAPVSSLSGAMDGSVGYAAPGGAERALVYAGSDGTSDLASGPMPSGPMPSGPMPSGPMIEALPVAGPAAANLGAPPPQWPPPAPAFAPGHGHAGQAPAGWGPPPWPGPAAPYPPGQPQPGWPPAQVNHPQPGWGPPPGSRPPGPVHPNQPQPNWGPSPTGPAQPQPNWGPPPASWPSATTPTGPLPGWSGPQPAGGTQSHPEREATPGHPSPIPAQPTAPWAPPPAQPPDQRDQRS